MTLGGVLITAKLMAWARSRITGHELTGNPAELWRTLTVRSRANWLERAANGIALLSLPQDASRQSVSSNDDNGNLKEEPLPVVEKVEKVHGQEG